MYYAAWYHHGKTLMELFQDIIFHQIRIRFDARYICKTEGLRVGRPVFYEKIITTSHCTIIIDVTTLAAMDEGDAPSVPGSLLICPGIPGQTIEISGCSVIGVESNISFPTLFNLLQEIYNRFDRWDAELTSVCQNGGSFQDLIDCTEAVVYDPISLVDMAFHYVAYCSRSLEKGLAEKHVDTQGNVPPEVVNEWVARNVYSEICQKTEVFSFSMNNADHLCNNIFYKNEIIGRLAIRIYEKNESTVLYYKVVLEHLAQAMSQLYRIHASFSQKENSRNSLRILLIKSLDQKSGSRKKWEKAIAENGWLKSDKYFLVQFRPNPRYDKNVYADYLIREIERRWQGCIGFEYHNRLMLLVNKERFSSNEDDMPFRQVLAYFLRESLLVAGISRTVNALKDIYPAYKQTEAAIEIGVSERPTSWSFNFEDYALFYLLKNGKGVFAPEYICSEKLLLLKHHDAIKNTEYFKTVKAYFLCRFNASAAAKKLFLHRSSFLNRMERIQKLAKIDFNSTDEWLYLAISFKIMEKSYSEPQAIPKQPDKYI